MLGKKRGEIVKYTVMFILHETNIEPKIHVCRTKFTIKRGVQNLKFRKLLSSIFFPIKNTILIYKIRIGEESNLIQH